MHNLPCKRISSIHFFVAETWVDDGGDCNLLGSKRHGLIIEMVVRKNCSDSKESSIIKQLFMQ